MVGGGGEKWPTGKINWSREKNEEKGGRGKIRQKREETPQKFLSAKLRKGGGE